MKNLAFLKPKPKLVLPSGLNYKITNEKKDKVLSKAIIYVNLSRKVDLITLTKISLIIRNRRKAFKQVFIYYTLGEISDLSFYGDAQFNPEMKVSINSSTPLEDEIMLIAPETDGHIISKWKAERALMGAVIYQVEDPSGKIVFIIKYKDNSISYNNTTKKDLNYYLNNSFEEYFRVEANGNLGIYDKDGKIDEAKKF